MILKVFSYLNDSIILYPTASTIYDTRTSGLKLMNFRRKKVKAK